MTVKIIRANSAASFLALVPVLAGYQPSDSLLIIPFSGVRSMGAARFDLPRNDAELEQIVSMLPRFGLADGVALVLYSSTQPMVSSPLVERVKGIVPVVQEMGYGVRDVLVVGPSEFYSLLEPGDPERYPVADIAAAAAEAGIDQPTGVAPGTLTPLVADDDTVRTIRELMRGIEPGFLWPVERANAIAAVIRGEGQPLDLARIGYAITDIKFRDDLFTWFSLGKPPAGMTEAEETELFMGLSDYPVQGKLLKLGAETMRTVAAATEDGPTAALALGVAAWCMWAIGLGSTAHTLLLAALEEDPENTLAPMLDMYVSTGRTPEWTYSIADKNLVDSFENH